MAAQEPSPLAERFAQLAQTHATQEAICFRGDEHQAARSLGDTLAYDFGKFWRRVQRVSAHLKASFGVQAGERVAWLGLNHELQLVTLVACARLGAIFMPMNFRLASAELQTLIDDAQPSLLVHDSAHSDHAHGLHASGLQRCHHDALIASAAPRNLPLPQVGGDTPLLLVYTSGTTGQPKGALHTQAALLANAQASAWAHGFVAGDKVLSTLPMFHVGGLCIQTLPALLAGVPVVLHPRFEASGWLHELQRSRPTLSLLVPATMRAVLEHPDWPQTDVSGLRGLMTGSSTIPVDYLHAFHARGVPVGQIYGSTETGPVSIVLQLQDAVQRVGSAGWPQPEAEVMLIDAEGHAVSPGASGEVCVRAPNVMRGYWNAQGLPGIGLQAGGWFHTGDLGQRGPDGCITIVGRSKDMLISGGENIYPAEIENLLVTLPGVAECAVLGLPDARWGEVPVAVLVRSANPEGQTLTQESVLEHLLQRIARFKLPRRVMFAASLPKNALGKVMKAAVLATLLTD